MMAVTRNTLLLPPLQWRVLSLIYNNNIPSQSSFLFFSSTARSPDDENKLNKKMKKKKKKKDNGSSTGSSSNIMSSEEWNKAWESSWLPEDHLVNSHTKAPWETTHVDLHFPSPSSSHQFPRHHNQQKQQQQEEEEEDLEARAFVEEMNENWSERRRGLLSLSKKMGSSSSSAVPSAGGRIEEENKGELKVKKQGYLGRKQVVHAGLWAKEIEKEVEEKLGVNASAAAGRHDDIDRLLDTCSQIFEHGNNETDDCESRGTVELKNKPDGWETTSKPQDGGNIWNLSQREEDILVQEYDRRIAYTKFRINSFIKSHIFSRRRPIDGWKYMIEELGPNSRKRKNELHKMTGLADTSMEEPFNEERIVSRGNISVQKRR